VLGGQRKEDFSAHDLVVVGPGVPRDSGYLKVALDAGKEIQNDASLFFRFNERPVVAVTGTRGKTTTTAWASALLGKRHKGITPTGNNPEHPFLKELSTKRPATAPVVAELSSWQLEYLPRAGKAPRVSAITNLYPDHLNRYSGMEDYADAKANIFTGQGPEDTLILNADDAWTPYFLSKKPLAKILFTSVHFLPKGKDGYFVSGGKIHRRIKGKNTTLFSVVCFRRDFGEHNLANLLQAVAAAETIDPKIRIIEKDVLSLATPRFRQEIVIRKKNILVINDSTATSPDGTVAAIRRFVPQGHVTLITGGTDKALEFSGLAKAIKENLRPEDVIFLEGSATVKLMKELGPEEGTVISYPTLEACVKHAQMAVAKGKGKRIILFSPGAASFEKFKNEFDRGEEFSRIAKRVIR
jgi:UDP-N-acetylmuramoylalanine--D-glutamate ligase